MRDPDRVPLRFPPPLCVAVPLAVGILLGVVAPWRFAVSGPVLAVALVLLVAGTLLTAMALRELKRAHTDITTRTATTVVVRGGPYRYSRNPIYLGGIVGYAGIALAVGSAWLVVLLPVVVAAYQYFAILPEERYLEERFGEDYRALKSSVRRWL